MNYFNSDYGTFRMPEGLYERTKWHTEKVEPSVPDSPYVIVKLPDPLPENAEFWDWIDTMNKEAMCGLI